MSKDADDDRARGFRYYEPAPYVLVYSDGKSGLVAKIVYLPDLSQKMAARPYNYLAGNTTKLNFVNGYLSESSSKIDTSAVPKALVESIKTAAIAAAKGVAGANQLVLDEQEVGFWVPTPRLYKIVMDETGVHLVGGAGGSGTMQVVRVGGDK